MGKSVGEADFKQFWAITRGDELKLKELHSAPLFFFVFRVCTAKCLPFCCYLLNGLMLFFIKCGNFR